MGGSSEYASLDETVTGINSDKPCPEQKAGFISRITYIWVQPMLVRGFKKPVEESDLWQIPEFLKANVLSDQWHIDWSKKRPVARSLCTCFLPIYWLLPLLRISVSILYCSNPFILRALIGAVKSNTTPSFDDLTHNIWFLSCMLFVGLLSQSTILHFNYWTGLKLALSARGAVMAATYRKALRMSLSGKRKGHTIGSIVNLMAVDADTVQMFFWNNFNNLWSAPIQIIALLVLLCVVVGPAGLLGFFTMIAVIPLNIHLARITNGFRHKARDFSDGRVKLIFEILQGIRLLKLYNWEQPFRDRVSAIRNDQGSFILKAQKNMLWSIFISSLLPGLVLAVTFTAYVLAGHVLDVQTAFTAVALFMNIKEPLNQMPAAVDAMLQYLIATQHIEDFLRSEEIRPIKDKERSQNGAAEIVDGEFYWDPPEGSDDDGANEIDDIVGPENGDVALKSKEKQTLLSGDDDSDEVDDEESASVKLDKNGETSVSGEVFTPTLASIKFRAPKGKLTCIVGPVGSGKSTLLHALLREVRPSRGAISVPDSLAYTPQIPWLVTATLRDNILFGRPMDQDRYQKVLEACALVKDLSILPAGDRTEIGEQGINLSGGQKQRVSLARALYSDAKCYIMDEPLSAVDAHVGTHLFDKCISGMMGEATRILVTHQLQFLPMADSIVVMDGGKVTHCGTYTELQEQGIDFQTLVRTKFQEITNSKTSAQEQKNAEGETTVMISRPSSPQLSNGEEGETPDQEISLEEDKNNANNASSSKSNSGALISAEERQTGGVGWDIYKEYFLAAGSMWYLGVAVGMYLITECAYIAADYWVSIWSSHKLDLPSLTYVYIYFGFVLFFAIMRRISTVCVQHMTHKSARNLHERLLDRVLAAKAGFFDTTPAGRIINRFSKDQDVLDTRLPQVIQDCLECGMLVMCTVGMICIITPMFTIALVFLVIMYYFIQRYYRRTSRELKRMESITRSPMYSYFSETMNGLTCIRAFKKQDTFTAQIDAKIDTNQGIFFYAFAVNRWLGFRLELLSALLVLSASLFSLMVRDSLGPGLIGLILACALGFAANLNWAVRQYTELEVQMNAVERVLHYINTIPQEKLATDPVPPAMDWPQKGAMEIQDLVVRYREDLDPVLRGISCKINAGEKIGIVGRTGAGKSTLTTAVFRLVEPSAGSVRIDDVDIGNIDLHVLRSRLSIIPQDPVLFSGSIRSNLDPFLRHSDMELWEVLRQVHLSNHVETLPGKLDSVVLENGEGFSLGQRQLLCLGRALLRKSKILVMDEATASLDFSTDALIKTTVRECFADKTLITIAHRLDTILDSDRVMVFEAGKIAEMDTPQNLMTQTPPSRFALLVEAARKSVEHMS